MNTMVIKPSVHLAMLLLLSHTVTTVVVYVTAMPQPAKFSIIVLILLNLFQCLARDVLLLFPRSWREIFCIAGGLSVAERNGSHFNGQVSVKTVVSPYFIVLDVCLEGGLLPAFHVVFPDAVGRDMFREFCVRLRFG